MIAHGFQGNLLGVRSVIEEFNFMAVGAMMSGYFVGYFAGANTIPKLVGKSWTYKSFCSLCINGVAKYSNSRNLCKPISLDFCKNYNRF